MIAQVPSCNYLIFYWFQESMQYDQLRDVVAKRIPGWEHLQEVR
jgi:hypothetical protein